MKLLPLLLLGCASHVPRFPGPLGPVAHHAPPAHVAQLPHADRPPGTGSAPAPTKNTPSRTAPSRSNPSKPAPTPTKVDPDGLGARIARAAAYHLDHAPDGFRDDCSGFAAAAYARAGLEISGSTAHLWEQAQAEGRIHRRKTPAPGDLVFFDNTYDRNKNGRRDDPLTHVGVVLKVDRDDTITVAHAGTSRGRTVLHLNLRDPDTVRAEDGTPRNDYLRSRRRGEPENADYLAGQLFRGFAAPR